MTLQPVCDSLYVAEPPGRNTYVVEPLRVLYVSVPKNACSSLKQLIAELAAEEFSGFRPDLVRRAAFHVRSAWRTPRLDQIDPELRQTISPANGWFIFAVVRDPRARLFSAWQNKFFTHPPAFREWNQADWYPQRPESPDDVVRDFARFVELLHTQPDHPLANDPHFSPQTPIVCPDTFPYSRVYDLAEMPTLLADLAGHMHAQGVDHDVRCARSNQTLLHANQRVFAEPVRSQIEQMYATDFENFGHLWDYGKIESAGEWAPDLLKEIRTRIAVNERMGSLIDIGLQERARAQRAEGQLKRTEGRLKRTEGQLRRTEGQLRRTEGQLKRTERQLKRTRQIVARADARATKLASMRSTRVGLAARALRGRVRRLANGR